MKSKYLHKSEADLPGLSFSKMRQLILIQVKRSNLNIIEDELNCLTIETAHGLVGLRKGKSCETASMVAGKDSRNLLNDLTRSFKDFSGCFLTGNDIF